MQRADDIYTFRNASKTDGLRAHQLVERCPPLDQNSLYCNLLQCHHFSATSVVAEKDGEMHGFLSGYRVPGHEHTMFVWQIMVAEEARGRRLAERMLLHLLQQLGPSVSYLETSITPDNEASQRLFTGLARTLKTDFSVSLFFDKQTHFGGDHSTENLYTIGPFDIRQISCQ